MSSIKFACSCGKAYKVPEKFSGKRVKCKKCGEAIRVPSQSQSGVVSTRAAAVSKRSMIESQRLQPGRSSRRSASKSGRSRRESAVSGRSSSKRSSRSSKRSPEQDGSKTERFEPIDLNEGNEIKKYKARKPEEFKRGDGRLTYYENGKAIKAFRLSKGEVTIGRDADCEVRLGLPSVSREHSKIEYKLGTFIVTDKQSKNGLVVNGRPVRRASLRSGDILQLGEGILRLDC